jgi:DNA-binding LacI/PurR family transcriptional regulator
LGHRRIGLIAWPEESLCGHYRYLGYVKALRAADIPPDPAWIVRTEHTEASGRQAMHALLGLPSDRRPTAVVAVSDLMAIGAMNAIYEAGLQPGQDVAVIGFDDLPTAQYRQPPLTTLRQPIAEVGERVVNMLLQLIRGEELTERKVLLPPTLIVRESSGGMIA